MLNKDVEKCLENSKQTLTISNSKSLKEKYLKRQEITKIPDHNIM